jgi:hypothetical protein
MNHIATNWLQNLDWNKDIGLNLKMLNDVFSPGRHEFYNQILQDNVKDRPCVEAGFGTGILSMLALRHGAVRVEAWEMDPRLYALGDFVINQLGVRDRINLVYGKFARKAIDTSKEIFFHEILDSNIWGEGLRSACPLDYDLILPGTVSVFFEKIIFSREIFKSIWLPDRTFDPRIFVYPGFTETIQNLLNHTPIKSVKRKDLNLTGVNLDFYQIDLNAKMLNNKEFNDIPESYSQRYHIDLMENEVACFYPWSRLSHGPYSLFWSWYDPLFFYFTGSYQITQSFIDGHYSISQ